MFCDLFCVERSKDLRLIVTHFLFSCLFSARCALTHDCGVVSVEIMWQRMLYWTMWQQKKTCWTVQLNAVDQFSPFFSFWKSCFSSFLTGAIVTTLNHRSNYNRELKWTVVVAAELIASTLLMSLFVIVAQRSLEGSQTRPTSSSSSLLLRSDYGQFVDSGPEDFFFFFLFSHNLRVLVFTLIRVLKAFTVAEH